MARLAVPENVSFQRLLIGGLPLRNDEGRLRLSPSNLVRRKSDCVLEALL